MDQQNRHGRKAPPAYRPLPPPHVLQRKTTSTSPAQKFSAPKAPAVYRPQPTPQVLQTKTKPAPPVYRPQPAPKVAQPKVSRSIRPAFPQPLKLQPPPHKRIAPPPLSPNITSPAQLKARNTIQRTISFTHGPRLRQNNVAESISSMVDYGITRTTLNGRSYPGGSREDFIGALLQPTLRVEARGSGAVAVSVQAVPAQNVGYLMELPTRGQWQLRVAAANIKVKLENQPIIEGVHIPIGSDETGSVLLDVRGLPTNAAFGDMVETHEDVHVADIRATVEEILRPWDAALTRFHNEGRQFEAPNQMTATAALYAAAGGTPRQIADRFVETLRQKGIAFHQTDAGKAPSIVAIGRSGPAKDSVLEVYMRHRAGLIERHEQRLEQEHRAREQVAHEAAVDRSLARRVTGSIAGSAGNSFITNDML